MNSSNPNNEKRVLSLEEVHFIQELKRVVGGIEREALARRRRGRKMRKKAQQEKDNRNQQ